MTTIVVDASQGLMAADRMVTSNDGDFAISCDTKIEEVEIGGDRYLVGLAGLEGPGLIFLEWFSEGDWEQPPEPTSVDEGEDFSVLVMGPDGIHVADRFNRLVPVHHRFYGIGSGGTIAWAVLEAGCGIRKAMETAIKMDPNSGFGYQVRFVDDPLLDYDMDC